MTTYNVNNSLTDPVELHNQYPNKPIINRYSLDFIEVGNYVKIRRNQEDFWVEVKEFDGENITGEVYYELGINKFKGGDLLQFKKDFCFDAYDPKVFNLIPNIHLVNS